MPTKEDLAKHLDGREYPMRLSKEELNVAKRNSLVVVTGASDDLMEFEVAINEECGAPGEAYVTTAGLVPDHDDCECPFCGYKAAIAKAHAIEARWCARIREAYHAVPVKIPWTFKTDIPHAVFNVMEDGEIFCRGIVFSLEDVK
jgi:hypothetical protein